jgi:hypothetical protein
MIAQDVILRTVLNSLSCLAPSRRLAHRRVSINHPRISRQNGEILFGFIFSDGLTHEKQEFTLIFNWNSSELGDVGSGAFTVFGYKVLAGQPSSPQLVCQTNDNDRARYPATLRRTVEEDIHGRRLDDGERQSRHR